jgi:hypothetical protein
MTRQEMWPQAYRHRPYLQHSTDAEVAERLRYIIENVTTLLPNEKIGMLPPEPDGKHWYELLEHVQEEYRRRGVAQPPEGFLKDARVPDPTSPMAAAAIKAVSGISVPAEGAYLVKLGKHHHMLDLCERGRLFLRPASYYADASLNSAIRDDELALDAFGLQSEVLIEVFDHRTGQRKAATRPLGNLTYTSRSRTNYYVYCMSQTLDFRLFGDFGYNACVVIRDPDEFEERLRKAVAEHLPGWIGMGGPVRYVDPFNCKKDDIDVFFGKHHRYSYRASIAAPGFLRPIRQERSIPFLPKWVQCGIFVNWCPLNEPDRERPRKAKATRNCAQSCRASRSLPKEPISVGSMARFARWRR